MHQSVADAFLPFTIPLEGKVNFMYLDVKSLVSTGIGNLLEQNEQPLPDTFTLDWEDKVTHVPASRDEVLQEWQTVNNSGTALATLAQKEAITHLVASDEAIQGLCTTKLNSFEDFLVNRPEFADLESWTADAQLGIFSMAWALGPAFRFPNFQAAAQNRDWLTAARECKMSEAGNPGVIPRNVRNGLLFTLAFWMEAPPPAEDFSVLVYDPSVKLADNMRSGNFPVPLNLAIGVQTALEHLGFDPNGLDGVFGQGTRTALTNFQASNGLQQTPNAKTIDDVPSETIDALASGLDAASIGRIP
jgi:hypothetical protein